jgi:formylmethanofuran dehydrogenase subunit C
MPLTLRWRSATTLSVAGAELSPETLEALAPADLARRPLRVGNGLAELGELFAIEGDGADGHLVLEGDLRRVGRVGAGMSRGRITIRGDAGPELGAEMSGGAIEVEGSAGDWTAAEMRGGSVHIRGTAGRFLGAAYPGSRRGMRDGLVLVEGSIGDDAGLAMRRGLIAVGGATGEGLGRGMIAGSIFVFGPAGRLPGAGMRRGTIALFGEGRPDGLALLPTFAPSGRARPPFLQVYLRHLARMRFPVPDEAYARACDRYNGDLAGGGQGEILVAS